MSDSHLANTINLIHRKAEVVRGTFKFFPGTVGGDEARELFLKAIVTYPALIREAERRKLRKEYKVDVPSPLVFSYAEVEARAMAELLRTPSARLCQCRKGIDTDGDGNCSVCAPRRRV